MVSSSPLAQVTAGFSSLSITRIATRKHCQPQGKKTPPQHHPHSAMGTRPQCCPLSASHRLGWRGGTWCGAHGGSPGAGCCESPAPGCRRWLVPLSSVLSPSPAAVVSLVCCPQPLREASAQHSGMDPEMRQRYMCQGSPAVSRPSCCFWKGQNELFPMQGSHPAFGEHASVTACPSTGPMGRGSLQVTKPGRQVLWG